uniref:Transposon protein, putative, unclassified n=1 Tax=Oryza sativa subsp. japonica TaxID=39947 RepID=Q2QWS0_ORYSJ|nr:transposon protein, putative, unclassified [Oryza sativa Japonica Group]
MSWHRAGVLLLGAQSCLPVPGVPAVGGIGSVLLSMARMGWKLCHVFRLYTVVENPEAFFRSIKPRVVAPQKTLPTKKPAILAPPTFKTMADKTLREFAAPSVGNVAIGPQLNLGDVDFDLKSSLITMA